MQMRRAPQVAPRNLSDTVLATNALNEFTTKNAASRGKGGRKRTGAIKWRQHSHGDRSTAGMATAPESTGDGALLTVK